MKRNKKTKVLVEMQEREREYLSTQEVGSDEYNKSFERMRDLEGDINRVKGDDKDRLIRVGDITMKTGLVAILAVAAFKFEEDGKIFTSTVGRGITKIFGLKL